jgi:hypothetical protein
MNVITHIARRVDVAETTPMTNDLMQTVTRVVDRGLKTNSYKLALLRSLVAIARKPANPPLKVTRLELAEQFVERYWPLALLFRIRQATVPDKEPVVMRLIRGEQTRLNFSSTMSFYRYRDKYPADYKKLLHGVARQAFDDVLPRFHTVHKRFVKPCLYQLDGSDIVIGEGSYKFLHCNARSVDLLALAGWVAFTEQFTSAPRLFEKIEGTPAGRKQLASYRTFLGATNGFACFYCGVPVPLNAPVDHVIPWAFVVEDKVWNLVIACQSCNSQKSCSIASTDFVEQLHERNEKLIALPKVSLPSLIRRELGEWSTRSLRDHLSVLAEQCRLDFAEWHPQLPAQMAPPYAEVVATATTSSSITSADKTVRN